MITAIKNWILGIEHSVEHILSDFYSAVERLERLAVQKMHLADTQDAIISAAITEKNDALKMANDAQNAAQKLKEIFN